MTPNTNQGYFWAIFEEKGYFLIKKIDELLTFLIFNL